MYIIYLTVQSYIKSNPIRKAYVLESEYRKLLLNLNFTCKLSDQFRYLNSGLRRNYGRNVCRKLYHNKRSYCMNYSSNLAKKSVDITL